MNNYTTTKIDTTTNHNNKEHSLINKISDAIKLSEEIIETFKLVYKSDVLSVLNRNENSVLNLEKIFNKIKYERAEYIKTHKIKILPEDELEKKSSLNECDLKSNLTHGIEDKTIKQKPSIKEIETIRIIEKKLIELNKKLSEIQQDKTQTGPKFIKLFGTFLSFAEVCSEEIREEIKLFYNNISKATFEDKITSEKERKPSIESHRANVPIKVISNPITSPANQLEEWNSKYQYRHRENSRTIPSIEAQFEDKITSEKELKPSIESHRANVPIKVISNPITPPTVNWDKSKNPTEHSNNPTEHSNNPTKHPNNSSRKNDKKIDCSVDSLFCSALSILSLGLLDDVKKNEPPNSSPSNPIEEIQNAIINFFNGNNSSKNK